MTKCLDFFKITYVLHLNIVHVCEKFCKDRPNIKNVMAIFRIARQYEYNSDHPR